MQSGDLVALLDFAVDVRHDRISDARSGDLHLRFIA